MITVLIADDEPLARYKLHKYVSAVPWLDLVANCDNGTDAIARARDTRAELLFLDIRMPGLLGTELIRRLDHTPAVVFTTAYDTYAVKAFELSAVDYLLKPFGRKRFLRTLERVRRVLERPDLPGAPRESDRLLLRVGDTITPIPLHTIVRFEACDDYVRVHTIDRPLLASVRMHELEERLAGTQFVRIHRSHLVNLDHVETMESHTSGRLVIRMTDGSSIFASRTRSHELRQAVL